MGAEGQLQTAGGTRFDTVNTRVVPILFVPGVMGSRLSIRGSAFDWDPDDHAVMTDWVVSRTPTVRKRISFATKAKVLTSLPTINLELGEDINAVDEILRRKQLVDIGTHGRQHSEVTTRRFVKEFYEARGWGGVSWTFYGKILMDVEATLNEGAGKATPRHPVYCFGYDWRSSNTTSGKAFIARIDEVLAAHKCRQVIVVTHSMGGLVTRSAIVQGATAKMAGVIHTVQPADGAVMAYRRFFTGADDDLDGKEPLHHHGQ